MENNMSSVDRSKGTITVLPSITETGQRFIENGTYSAATITREDLWKLMAPVKPYLLQRSPGEEAAYQRKIARDDRASAQNRLTRLFAMSKVLTEENEPLEGWVCRVCTTDDEYDECERLWSASEQNRSTNPASDSFESPLYPTPFLAIVPKLGLYQSATPLGIPSDQTELRESLPDEIVINQSFTWITYSYHSASDHSSEWKTVDPYLMRLNNRTLWPLGELSFEAHVLAGQKEALTENVKSIVESDRRKGELPQDLTVRVYDDQATLDHLTAYSALQAKVITNDD